MRSSYRQSLWLTFLCVGIGGFLLGTTIFVWRAGLLQSFDLKYYDQFVRHASPSRPDLSPIVIIGITEEDITSQAYGGWPINDAKLAELIDWLAARRPAAVGVDLFRDLPVPNSGAELPQLERALLQHTNVVMIQKFGDNRERGIPPPPVLLSRPGRIGINDYPLDSVDDTVRRGFLYLDDGKTTYESLAWRLAQLCLAREGTSPAPSEQNPEFVRLGHAMFAPLEKNDGAYVNLDADGYQVLLDFRGPAKFKSFSLHEVFAGTVPETELADKIVIVGVTARSVKDRFATALQREQFGVEIHAHFVDQLVRDARGLSPVMRFVPERWEVLWLLLWWGIGVVAGSWLRSPWTFFGGLLGGVLTLALISWWQFSEARWLPSAPPIAAFVVADIFVASFRAYQDKRQRALMMTLFSKHVSREIAADIWQHRSDFLDGQRPKAQNLIATVFFSDIRGFTTVSEKLTPAQLMEWLNDYMEIMSAEILQRGGVINEYMGDGIMATFGIPVPRNSPEEIAGDARNAVEAALGMAAALERLNARWRIEAKPPISMRVGIFTGPLVSGSLGSRERMKYTVIGDTVNTASRLESSKKDLNDPRSPIPACRILVGKSTWDMVRDRFEGEFQGSFDLKGKANEVIVTQVFSRKKS